MVLCIVIFFGFRELRLVGFLYYLFIDSIIRCEIFLLLEFVVVSGVI